MLQELQAPIHPQQKAKVIEAIRDLKLRVSPADVATKSNLPVLVATQILNDVASDTAAHLEVSDKGSILYAFDQNFEQSYALSGPNHAMRRFGRIALNALLALARVVFVVGFFLVRISFGVLLILSVVAVVVVVGMVLFRVFVDGADGSGNSSDGGMDGGSMDLSNIFDASALYIERPFWLYLTFDWLWDWMYYGNYMWGNPYVTYTPDPEPVGEMEKYEGAWGSYSGTGDESAKSKSRKKSKFLDYCFMLLFGPPDPNSKLEDERWKDCAEVIRLNSGVVVAEQLAPYLESNPNNEDWMLPILQRFNGLPEVSEKGNIIYTFPQFQEAATAHSAQNAGLIETTPQLSDLNAIYTQHLNRQRVINQSEAIKRVLSPYLVESPVGLGVPNGDIVKILCTAAFAFGGSMMLLSMPPFDFVERLAPLFTVISVYCSLYFLVPTVRYALNTYVNVGIEMRNDARQVNAVKLNNPDPQLKTKLEEARAVAVHGLVEKSGDLFYTTEKDDLEQQFPS